MWLCPGLTRAVYLALRMMAWLACIRIEKKRELQIEFEDPFNSTNGHPLCIALGVKT